MADITALDKYPCAACGAQAQWNPAKQLLVCPFCGSSAPFSIDAATLKIEELDLAKALREIPDQDRGWQAEKRTVQCQSCKAVSVFDPDRVGQNCDFCGSPSLVDYAEIKAPIRPQSLLPFTVTEASVREQIRKWYASKWLAPGKLKSRALVDRVHGVYIPYWTFDAQVVCPWDAEAGHYYYTTETYQEGGRTRTRQVRHVRWVPAVRRDSALFRRRADSWHAGCLAHLAEAGRTVPDAGIAALRSRLPVGIRRRALSDRALRRCPELAGGDGDQAASDGGRADSGRYLP